MPDINRRKLLKAIGATASTSTLVAGSAAAQGHKKVPGTPKTVSVTEYGPEDDELENVLNVPKVKSIIDAVQGIESGDATRKEIEISETTIKGWEISTNVGVLIFAESSSGETEAKLNLDDLSKKTGVKKHLPRQYKSVPRNSQMAIVGHEESISMLRLATDKEVGKIQKRAPGSTDIIRAAYDSNEGAFLALSEENKMYRVEKKGNGHGRAIPSRNIDEVTPTLAFTDTSTPLSSVNGENPISTQDALDCGLSCAACVSAALSKGLCYWSCFQSAGLTCLVCIANTNVALPLACAQCFEDCGISA